MIFLIIGTTGFIFLLLFDICLLYKKNRLKYLFGLTGLTLILGSTALIFTLQSEILIYLPIRIFFGILMILTCFLLIYSVFFEVGIESFALKNKNSLVTTGTYALSRHPGVLWLLLLYIFAFLAFQNYYLLYAGLLWTATNVVYVYLQEKFIFKKLFEDYHKYIQSTPMLFPNQKSIGRFLTTRDWRKK